MGSQNRMDLGIGAENSRFLNNFKENIKRNLQIFKIKNIFIILNINK